MAATISISNCQQFEANYCQSVKKLRFSVIFGIFFTEKPHLFDSGVYLSLLEILFNEKYIIKAGLIDEIYVYLKYLRLIMFYQSMSFYL